jgi:hypothetical protein
VIFAALTISIAAQSPEEVVRRAAENEARLKSAELDYSYKQEVIIQTFGEANSVTGYLRRLSEITYDDLGNRVDRIVEYPPSGLTRLLGKAEVNFKTLLGIEPFFLTAESLSRYATKYLGRQKLDELDTYVFEVEPRSFDPTKKKSRYSDEDRPFKGKIWVDDQDLQIVKIEGRVLTAKDDPERFPKFECYREQLGEKLWLPSYVLADDVLEFKRFDLPIKIEIKYSDYKLIRRKT